MKKYIGIGLVLSCMLLLGGTYAQSSINDQIKEKKHMHMQAWKTDRDMAKEKGMMRNDDIALSWQTLRDDRNHLGDYIADDLSDEDIASLRVLLKETYETVKTMQKEFIEDFTESDTAEDTIAELVAELSAVWKETHDEIKIYIDETEQESYDDFVEAWLITYTENKTKRLLNRTDKKTFKQGKKMARKHHLPHEFTKKLHRILSSVSEDTKEEMLTRFLGVLEKKVEHITGSTTMVDDNKERMLDFLAEIYDIIEAELDLLTEDTDGDLIETLLEDMIE